MEEIVSSVQRVSNIVGEISVAASAQATRIDHINAAVNELDHMTQQNAALVEQSAAAAKSLKNQGDRLNVAVARFKLFEHVRTARASGWSATAWRLATALKCRACGKTFNALKGTPLARLRHKGKWLEQTRAMADGLTVHRAADFLDVAPSTAFRWRHRFLGALRVVKPASLTGVAEMDETYFLESRAARSSAVQLASAGDGQPSEARLESRFQCWSRATARA